MRLIWTHGKRSAVACRKKILNKYRDYPNFAVCRVAKSSCANSSRITLLPTTKKMLNALKAAPKSEAAVHAEVIEEGLSILLRVLSPITPHIAHALWQDLGYGADILTAQWPEPLEAALVRNVWRGTAPEGAAARLAAIVLAQHAHLAGQDLTTGTVAFLPATAA